MAEIHSAAFPSYFLSSLGEPFLRELYLGFASIESAVTVVAQTSDGRVVGAAVGTTEPASFFRHLLLRRLPGFAAASALAAIRRPAIAVRLVRGLAYRGQSEPGADGALLSSICVDPACQGAGVGGRLLSEWLAAASRAGAPGAHLTTDARDNDQVLTFYANSGFRQVHTFTTKEAREMALLHIDLSSEPSGGHA